MIFWTYAKGEEALRKDGPGQCRTTAKSIKKYEEKQSRQKQTGSETDVKILNLESEQGTNSRAASNLHSEITDSVATKTKLIEHKKPTNRSFARNGFSVRCIAVAMAKNINSDDVSDNKNCKKPTNWW